MWRAGFGPAVEQLGVLDNTSPEKLYKALQKASAKRPQYLQAADSSLQGLMLGIQDAGRLQKQEMSPEQRRSVSAERPFRGRGAVAEATQGRGA